MSFSDPDPIFFDDPQAPGDLFPFKHFHHLADDVKDVAFILVTEAQHDQSGMDAWRICANVAEIQVKRHKRSIFIGTDFNDVLIGGADQAFVKDCLGVMS